MRAKNAAFCAILAAGSRAMATQSICIRGSKARHIQHTANRQVREAGVILYAIESFLSDGGDRRAIHNQRGLMRRRCSLLMPRMALIFD